MNYVDAVIKYFPFGCQVTFLLYGLAKFVVDDDFFNIKRPDNDRNTGEAVIAKETSDYKTKGVNNVSSNIELTSSREDIQSNKNKEDNNKRKNTKDINNKGNFIEVKDDKNSIEPKDDKTSIEVKDDKTSIEVKDDKTSELNISKETKNNRELNNNCKKQEIIKKAPSHCNRNELHRKKENNMKSENPRQNENTKQEFDKLLVDLAERNGTSEHYSTETVGEYLLRKVGYENEYRKKSENIKK